MKNKGYAKFWGANKVNYGKYGSGVLPNSNQGGLDTSLCVMRQTTHDPYSQKKSSAICKILKFGVNRANF